MQKANSDSPNNYPVVLIMEIFATGTGGQETHAFNLYKLLSDRGRRPLLLTRANSSLHRQVIKAGLCCYAIPHYQFPASYRLLNLFLTLILLWVCKRRRVRVIHCNNRFELHSARRVAKFLDVSVVLNYHVTAEFDVNILKGIKAFIAPSQSVVDFVTQQSRDHSIKLFATQVLPPIFDANRFINYRSTAQPAAWFRSTFGIEIKPATIVCTIGNMVEDLQHKNYPLLFEALAIVLHRMHLKVQVVIAGDGPVRSHLEEIARDLNVRDHVHFLGSTSENTPGVLHHSDVFVLASSREAFGIVYLEAGLTRKPSIGARETGAEKIIVDHQTGLLFDNGSADSLAAAIAELVERPSCAFRLGSYAYDHITSHFLPAVVIEHYEDLYASLASTPQDGQAIANSD